MQQNSLPFVGIFEQVASTHDDTPWGASGPSHAKVNVPRDVSRCACSMQQ